MRLHNRAALPGHEQRIMGAAPQIDSAMEMVIACWRNLHSERQLGFGALGLIPWSAIQAWARRRGLDHDLTDMLTAVIERLDADRTEREAAARALKQGGSGGR